MTRPPPKFEHGDTVELTDSLFDANGFVFVEVKDFRNELHRESMFRKGMVGEIVESIPNESTRCLDIWEYTVMFIWQGKTAQNKNPIRERFLKLKKRFGNE